jgi:hypothetical protein
MAWESYRNVHRVFATVNPSNAYALITGHDWLKISPLSPDGVTNVFIVLNTAMVQDRRVDVFITEAGMIHAAAVSP